MRRIIFSLVMMNAMVAVLADQAKSDEPATAAWPATRPAATQPVGATISGTVEVSPGWTLQKPDLSRVVVFLASDSKLDEAARPEGHVCVAQRNKAFVPNFAVVPRGTDVEFPNWDDFDHNVFSCSKAAPAFDLDRYPRGQSKTRTFEKIGVVQVFCNIHPQMRAIIFVTPNIYFAKADANGKFMLGNVPPGNYELVAWQERCGEQRQAITVAAETGAEVTFTLREDRDSIMANDPPKKAANYGVGNGLGIKRDRLNLPVVQDAHAALDPEPAK